MRAQLGRRTVGPHTSSSGTQRSHLIWLRRSWSALALLLAAGLGISLLRPAASPAQSTPLAPDFTLPVKFKMPQPDTISLKSYQGKQNALLLFYLLDWSPG